MGWKQETESAEWSARRGHSSVVFDGKIWIMGGEDVVSRLNDVWYSTNGSTWTEATASAGWSERFYHISKAFQEKIYMIAGYNIDGLRDVWSSTNGATWIKEFETSSWDKKWSFSCDVLNDKLLVMGGANNTNDVWSWPHTQDTTAPATEDSHGIILGTSDAAFNTAHTNLTTPITHGTGAGQLEYGANPETLLVQEPAVSGSKTTMKMARRVENNSGSPITVKEVGIKTQAGTLICRLVDSTGTTLADGESRTFIVEWETEV
jgi:hypothetical protein